MKKIITIMVYIIISISLIFANNYTLFYGQGCPHCEKVRKFIVNQQLSGYIIQKEVYFNKNNQQLFLQTIKDLGLKQQNVGVPFLYIEKNNQKLYKIGDTDVINYIKNNLQDIKNSLLSGKIENNYLKKKDSANVGNISKFLLIMIPAAISDSINPCAFAVILILLGAILYKYKDRKKALLSGLSFSLSIFLSYYLMGLGLYHTLGNISNTNILKITVGIIGIIVGLANLKDFFRYGKLFVMEVPFSRRNKLKKILNSITNPIGAFFVGLAVSLFLLPCTSGPYITILGYLSSENHYISGLGYFYLFIYNVIFILPMVIITYLISMGIYSTEFLLEKKDKYTKLIHLIVGILMLLLGIYVLYDVMV